MADEQFDPGGDNSVVVGHGGPASGADNAGAPFDPGGSRYPDMTPGPPKPVLGTSYHSLPSDTRGGMPWDNWQPPSFSGAAGRIGTEMQEAYQNTPPLLTAEARDALRNSGWLGKGAAILGDVGSTALADFSALGAGGMAALSELGSGGDPKLARDIHAGLTIAPVLQSGAPRFAGPLLAGREQLTGGDPLQARTINTPEAAMKFYNPQIKLAEQSDFRLAPKFTDDWLASLEDHTTTSPAGKAVNPEAPPIAKLIGDLRNAASAPLDNIKSIQEVDQRIQRAISEQSGSGGDPNQVRQMRGILQDFRDRYGNVPPDQYTGSPQGVAAFQDSLKSYAAVSRLREVQGIIDSTEGNPNRSTLLASRVNAFLNDDRNTKGWNDAERASLRQAANSGFMQEWMRAQGSRLVGIGSAALAGTGGAAVGVPLQVGISYALRNAMEDMRLNKVRAAMGVLGQRVPQPGTVPAAPVPRVPSQAAVTAARYAPLVGLLGQTTDQPRDARPLPSL
jgi:hypothetical protein